MEHFVKSFDEFIGNDNAVDKSADYKAAEELANNVPDKIKGAEGNAENTVDGVDLWDYIKLEFENLHNKIWDLGKKTTDKKWKSVLTVFVSDLAKIEEKISSFTEKLGAVSLVPKDEEVKENATQDVNEGITIQIDNDKHQKMKLKDLPGYVQTTVELIQSSSFKVSYIWTEYGRYFVGLNASSGKIKNLKHLLDMMPGEYNFGYDDYYKVLYVDIIR